MASVIKKTATGLTGLAVANNPHHTLNVLYGKILRSLQKMPEESAYKKYTKDIITERAMIVKNTSEVAVIEEKIGCGQIEELIIQAENELLLTRKILGWKPWEPLLKEAPENQWKWPAGTN